MRVIIIEDEVPAAKRLEKLLHSYNASIEVVKKIDSIEASVRYLAAVENIDIIFMDIQLADGLSFDIFEKVKITTPVIFTTAFDQ
jgi:DNA-binding response OmpR family regulator